jgi:hypothetical protein
MSLEQISPNTFRVSSNKKKNQPKSTFRERINKKYNTYPTVEQKQLTNYLDLKIEFQKYNLY